MSLLAAVIHLAPERSLPTWLGRAAQAWLLNAVRQTAPDLADHLHRGQARRPYTVSVPRGGTDTPWLRITSASSDLTAVLLDSVLPNLAHLTLAGIPIAVTKIETQGHSWAGRSDFETLAHDAFGSTQHNSPGFEFATLTAFHQNGLSVPLPIPALVYGSLIQAWNNFSPVPLPVRLDDFTQNYMSISRHRIATGRVSVAASEQHTGFKGTVNYIFLPQEKTPYSADEYYQRLQTIEMLTSFAFYAGVGIRTTVGMGQVRPLP